MYNWKYLPENMFGERRVITSCLESYGVYGRMVFPESTTSCKSTMPLEQIYILRFYAIYLKLGALHVSDANNETSTVCTIFQTDDHK